MVIAPNGGQFDIAGSQNSGERPNSGTWFNTSTDWVKIDKRPTVSLYLNELLN